CSRELPKCNTCKPWPGECIYSRDTFDVNSLGAGSADERTIESRLQDLEELVQQLSKSVDKALQVIASAPARTDDLRPPSDTDQRTVVEKDRSNPKLYIGPSHSFSFLREASASIEKIPRPPSDATHLSAHSELRYLSSQLGTSHVEQMTEKSAAVFHVPSKATGYRMISRFFQIADVGKPFFISPPDEVMVQVVFEPHRVQEKAWVVYFNYMLLAAVPVEEDSEEGAVLRRNVHLALNNSSIFLEPREVNVQVLAFLAMHGEDYAAPNTSWMLLGSACRQAEALGMHISGPQGSSESRQHQLCLFWLLFLMDKSCSLAFGRPVFLPTALYHHVPLPDESTLLMFQPHTRMHGTEIPQRVSHFGAQMLRCSIELAKLMGILADILATGHSAIYSRMELRSKLNAWYSYSNQRMAEILEFERASSTADQVREMALGINSMKFQYLHVLILLLKGEEFSSSLRLSSAREALSLLTSMVSNWNSVYNGVIWHLLYYPFTSFFVIFENIVHHSGPMTPTVAHDLNLLATTVTYFASMRSQMRLLATLCTRLEHVAATFLQLARNFHSASTGTEGPPCEWHDHERTRVEVEELNGSSYLDLLPADMGALSGHNPLGKGKETRRTFDSMFDWFSWDTYYGDLQG
ncbi:fungal specific transcription factor domain-containing protein, partial [Aspergillus fijiensis CBS 313.89]